MECPGLLSWANAIRATMANDPGRQLFKDQVQTHGFLFLDEYLDNIVSGTKQDPLIELVKTPGRKKVIGRKPKLASSKLAKIPSVFPEENDNENAAPSDSLQQSLFPTKSATSELLVDSSKDIINPKSGKALEPVSPRPALVSIQIVNRPPEDAPASQAIPIPSVHGQPLVKEHVSNPNTPQHELSIIAEDDEPSERRQSSILVQTNSQPPASIVMAKAFDGSVSPFRAAEQQASCISEHGMESTSSLDTFHSIPLGSPAPTRANEMYLSYSDASHMKSPEEPMVGVEVNPVAQPISFDHLHDRDMDDVQEEGSTTSQKPIEKVATSFPTLPEPMPLRKSIRPTRDPSIHTVLLGAATPGAPVGGKRTSWLMKAREVKALEVTNKKSTAPAIVSVTSVVNGLPQGNKRKSGDLFNLPEDRGDSEERQPKSMKTTDGETAPRPSKEAELVIAKGFNAAVDQVAFVQEPQEGVLDRLKKTVEGLGTRVSKNMGKSLGGGAATALAEAKAAAEAKVAERDRKEEEMTIGMGNPAHALQEPVSNAMPSKAEYGRLSVSDLFPTDTRMKEKHKVAEKPFQFKPNPEIRPLGLKEDISRTSTSTTPPHSPPTSHGKNFALPSAPVFNKPPPVFVPPAPTLHEALTSIHHTRPSPSLAEYNVPTSMALGLSPRLPSSRPPVMPLTAHSTLESVKSDVIFDDREDVPAWMPSTQDTEYASGYASQSQPQGTQLCDEDDSWPMDEKLAAGVQWTFGGSKDDSMTWSTLPSQSQRGDTGPITRASPIREEASELETAQLSRGVPGAFDVDMDGEGLGPRDAELDELVLGSKSTITLVESKTGPPRSQSQMSMASSASSQSQGGLFGQASKLLSSALGTSKKSKQPEVKKVLQMAAVAARKQQEEADKKAARLKEMESRRQLAIQRKAEEEKAKANEEERKMKEEADRRKREREEMTEKRPLKLATSKKEDETQKKWKTESDKKQELKKPTQTAIIGKGHLKSALKQPSTTTLHHSSSQNLVSTSATAHGSKSAADYKGKSQVMHNMDEETSQPSMLVQTQMAARAKAQLDAAKHVEPPIPSESIELPDINSEYSDSEDEDRPRTFDPPEWAQSPELRQALEMQSTINPDDIFGAVRPLRMEEIFKTRTSRFRARTSSANWTGTDRLTIQEEREYARRMGFK